MFKRAELDMEHPPGQIVNPVGEPHHVGGRTDTPLTLGDYIKRKEAAINKESKKMTFEEWYQQRMIDFDGNHPSAFIVWQAAQENK